MIERAAQLNAAIPRCRFMVNVSDNLEVFPDSSFDLVYSSIVLQHVPSRCLILHCIAEFLRVVKPGGIVVFQLPSFLPYRNRLQLRRRVYAMLRSLSVPAGFLYQGGRLSPMRMQFVPEQQVIDAIRTHGAEVLSVSRSDRGVAGLVSCTYFVKKVGRTTVAQERSTI